MLIFCGLYLGVFPNETLRLLRGVKIWVGWCTNSSEGRAL